MNIAEYFKLTIEQQKNCSKEMFDSIKEQDRLHDITVEKARIRWSLEDKSRELIIAGTNKLKEKYPDLLERLNTSEIKSKAIIQIYNAKLNNTEIYREVIARQKEIPEFVENYKLLDELSEVTYDYFNSLIALFYKINSDRKKFFTQEYVNRMDELAEEGVLLYFLETPDMPLLSKGVDSKIIMDYLLYDNLRALGIILSGYVNCNYDSIIMKRKAQDVVDVYNLLDNKGYRSAARTMFALLDSTHKRCANVFEGFWAKKKEYKTGKQRAIKVDELVSKIDVEWYQHAWDKVNIYWEKITSTNPIEGVIHRNTIIHGDYESDLSDLSNYDIVKLILLWLNMNMIADYLSHIEDLYDNITTMLPSISREMEEQCTNTSND